MAFAGIPVRRKLQESRPGADLDQDLRFLLTLYSAYLQYWAVAAMLAVKCSCSSRVTLSTGVDGKIMNRRVLTWDEKQFSVV